MASRDRLALIESLQEGETTLKAAATTEAARFARVEELVLATAERGSRQTPSICRKAEVAPWLQLRHATPAQIDRLDAELNG
jgi:hypothetical protein